MRPEDVSMYWCEPLAHPAEGQGEVLPEPIPVAPEDDGLGGLVARSEEADESRADER